MSNGNEAKITNVQRNMWKTITLWWPGSENGVKNKWEEDSFTANSETSGNWTGWHYVWMRIVFRLMAGKLFRGMLELFGRIPLAWGSPPPLMMNRVGSAAFPSWHSNLADSGAASLIASAELQKEAWLKFGLKSLLVHSNETLHRTCIINSIYYCHMNSCTKIKPWSFGQLRSFICCIKNES